MQIDDRAHPTHRLIPLALTVLLALGLLAVTGCADDRGVEAESLGEAGALSPHELGTLGARLHRSPEEADAILASEGLTWEEFESAVRAVSADVDDARAYSEAFETVGEPGDSAPAGAGGA